jgi:hypothetical protein
MLILVFKSCSIVQAVSRRPLTADDRMRSYAIGGQMGTGTSFSPSSWTLSLSVPSNYFFAVFYIHVLVFLEGQKTKLRVFPAINTGLENRGTLDRKVL